MRNQGTDRGPARTDGAAAAETPPHRGRRRDAFACGVQERSHPGAAFGVTHRREGAALGAAGLEEVRTAKLRAVRPCPPPTPPPRAERGAPFTLIPIPGLERAARCSLLDPGTEEQESTGAGRRGRCSGLAPDRLDHRAVPRTGPVEKLIA